MVEDKRFYGKAGKEYELFKLACPHYDVLQKTLAEEILKSVNDRKAEALELGCGPGYTTYEVLRKVPNIRITSVDNESTMIKKAKYVLSEFIKESKVQLIEQDALEYLKNQKKNSFDVFFSAFTLHNLKKDYREELLKELHRVLKDKGIFVNADKYANNDPSEHLDDLNWQINNFNVYDKGGRADLKEVWTKHYKEDNKEEIIMIEDEAMKQMKEIGYEGIKKVFREKMEAIIIAKVNKK